MFKNIITYRIAPDWVPSLDALVESLNKDKFVSCEPSQESSHGWIEPRGEDNASLVESIDNQWILKICRETKILPSSVVKSEVEKVVSNIEQTTGRKPGKKECKIIAEDVHFSLLSKAFTKKSHSFVWINLADRLLVIEASTSRKADETITLLMKSLDGLVITPLETQESPVKCMTEWLVTQEPPYNFTADRNCVLKATDESKASIRYASHRLDIDEIREHIKAGKLPSQLAMTWNDKISFVLCDSGVIKKIEVLECDVAEKSSAVAKGERFDADIAILTGLLKEMIPDLANALGGEVNENNLNSD